MNVTAEEVRRIAGLARLSLAEDRVAHLARELSGILKHVEVLQGVPLPDEEGVEGAESTVGRDPALPPDPLEDGALATLAPDFREGFFALPRLAALDGGEG